MPLGGSKKNGKGDYAGAKIWDVGGEKYTNDGTRGDRVTILGITTDSPMARCNWGDLTMTVKCGPQGKLTTSYTT